MTRKTLYRKYIFWAVIYTVIAFLSTALIEKIILADAAPVEGGGGGGGGASPLSSIFGFFAYTLRKTSILLVKGVGIMTKFSNLASPSISVSASAR